MNIFYNKKTMFILESEFDLTDIFMDMQILSSEQKDFYLANKARNPNVHEVLSGIMDEDYIQPLAEKKAQYLQILSDNSLVAKDRKYPRHVIENVLYGTYDVNDASMPNFTEIQDFFINCRNEYYRVKQLIDTAITHEEVDQAFNSANFE